MDNFRRSLRYLWPYRSRLMLAGVCIIIIATLWAGGLGMLGPAARVFMDDAGLHGWAYSRMASDRLDESSIMVLTAPPDDPNQVQAQSQPAEESQQVSPIVLVVTKAKGVAKDAGIVDGHWLVGLMTDANDYEPIRGDVLMRTIAQSQTGETIRLQVLNPVTRAHRRVDVKLQEPSWSSRTLSRIVGMIPEPKTPGDRYYIFLGVLAIVLITTYLRDLFRFFQEYLVETAVYRGIIDLRGDTYNAALQLPLTFYSEKGTTDTMSRFMQDTNGLARAQVTLFGKTLAEPAKAIGAIIMAFCFSWELTLLALLAGPPAYLLIRKLGKRMKRASKKALEGMAVLFQVLEETLNGIRVVKVFTMEGTERRRFFQANRNLYTQQKKIAKIDAATGPAVEAMGITAAVCAGALGGYWVFKGLMDPENFLVVMALLAAMFDPLRKLSKVVTRFQRAEAAAERVFEIHDRKKEKSLPGAPSLPRHSRDIELRNVRFQYPNAAEPALDDVSLTIKAGQTVAIVGPNGCGKTTLVSLLPRLIDPAAGTVLIDGKDISQYSIRSVRRQIAVVTQETVIFHATIRENISYGLRRPKDADVLLAARRAFVDEFVRDLPEGYDTMVGEHGATLSGGQRQRIAIARAILRDPAILIFDEATSQIDADSEQRIHQAMSEFITGRTTIMIAHRFATVLQADRIIAMNAGRIVDVGTHDELLQRCELYSHLYETQLADSGG